MTWIQIGPGILPSSLWLGYAGIGTTSPGAGLQVANGQVAGTYLSSASGSINFNSGNIQSTSVAPGTITFATAQAEGSASG